MLIKNKKNKFLSNKEIKHIYSKWQVYNALTQKKQKQKKLSLLFFGQGLNTKELIQLRILFSLVGLHIKKISRKTWHNGIATQANQLRVDKKLSFAKPSQTQIKNKFYGDIFILYHLNNEQGNEIINYIYKQLVNLIVFKQVNYLSIWKQNTILNLHDEFFKQQKKFFFSVKDSLFDQILTINSSLPNKDNQPKQIFSSKTPWHLSAGGTLSQVKATKDKQILKQLKNNYIATWFRIIFEQNLIFTGLIKDNLEGKDLSNNFFSHKYLDLHIEYFNPQLYIDFDVRNISQLNLKNKKFLTPYDLILETCVINLDNSYVNLQGISKQFICFL